MKGNKRPLGLETEPDSVQSNQCQARTPRNGLFCHQDVHPATQVLQLAPRPSSPGHRCLSSAVGGPELCQPPLDFDTSGAFRSEEPESQHCTNSPGMENTSLVRPNSFVTLNRLSNHTTNAGHHDIVQVNRVPLPVRGNEVQLAAWPILGVPAKQEAYQRELQSSSWHHGVPSRSQLMTHSLANGNAGVTNVGVVPWPRCRRHCQFSRRVISRGL